MKKLAAFALLLSLSMFSIGCQKADKGGTDAPADTSTDAPADAQADAPADAPADQ